MDTFGVIVGKMSVSKGWCKKKRWLVYRVAMQVCFGSRGRNSISGSCQSVLV